MTDWRTRAIHAEEDLKIDREFHRIDMDQLAAYAEVLRAALGDAVKLIEDHVPEGALGYDSSGDMEEAHLTFSWPRKIEALHYLRKDLATTPPDALAEMRENKKLETQLAYKQGQNIADAHMIEMAELRDRVIEECAEVAVKHETATCTGQINQTEAMRLGARSIANAIRSLKSKDKADD